MFETSKNVLKTEKRCCFKIISINNTFSAKHVVKRARTSGGRGASLFIKLGGGEFKER